MFIDCLFEPHFNGSCYSDLALHIIICLPSVAVFWVGRLVSCVFKWTKVSLHTDSVKHFTILPWHPYTQFSAY